MRLREDADIGPEHKIICTITAAKLESIESLGNGNIEIDGLDGGDFAARLFAGGDITVAGRVELS